MTPEGEKAIELGEEKLLETATLAYKQWKLEKESSETSDNDSDLELENGFQQANEATLDTYQENALEGLKNYIRKLNPYDFQDLVAALLRGMGYYTPFVAPKGKDGDVGIFVSTGGFTSDCKHEVRSSHTHLELIGFDRFINLWQEFYEKLPDEDKKRLPLTPIYFLGI